MADPSNAPLHSKTFSRHLLQGENTADRRARAREHGKFPSYFEPNTVSAFLSERENAIEFLRDGSVAHRLSRFEPLARLGHHTVLVKGYIALYFKEGNDVVIAHLFPQSQDYASIVLNGE